jgi:hypothetical protein
VLTRFVLKEYQINSKNQTPKGNNINEIESHEMIILTLQYKERLRLLKLVQGDDATIVEGVSCHTNGNDTSFQPDIYLIQECGTHLILK